MAMPPPFPPDAAFRLLNQSKDVFVIADTSATLRYVSPSAANLFGFKNIDVLGKSATYFIHPDEHGALGALCNDAVEHTTSRGSVRLRHRTTQQGGYVPMDCKAAFDGTFIFLVMLDASEATRFENSLRDVRSTSHELRTPVHSLQMCAALMLGEPTCAADAEAVGLLRGVQNACEVLSLLVGNVLSLSRLQAPPRISVAEFDLRACMAHAVELICGSRVAWRGGGAAALPARARGDALQVSHCVQNTLITLARMLAWEAPDAPLQLQAQCDSGAAADATLHFAAFAPGVKLGFDECDALIAPFGMSPVEKGNVAGLPLFLARRMARAMGGELELACAADGIRVQLRLPLRAAAPPGAPSALQTTEPSRIASEVAAAAKPASSAPSPAASPGPLPPRMTELEVSQRMFSFLTSASEDLFLICELSQHSESSQHEVHQLQERLPLLPPAPARVSARIAYASPNVARLLGWEAAELQGRELGDALLAGGDDAAVADAAFCEALAAARGAPGWQAHVAFCARARKKAADAAPGAAWMDVTGVVDESGACYAVLRDAAPRKANEAALRRFSLATTHALRDPCAAILVGASLLERRPCCTPSGEHGSTDTAYLLKAMRAACALLLGIVANVLSARAIEAGELALQLVPFSIADVVQRVMQSVQLAGGGSMAAHASPFTWERQPTDALPELVEGDRDRIAQVLQNLCTNAMRHGAGRPVRVRVHLDWRSQLVMTVRDEGPGLSLEQAQTCWQSVSSRDAASGGAAAAGAGLGLFVSQTLAALMRGSLTVSSSPGAGASFTLAVPVRVLAAGEAATVRAVAAVAVAAADAETGRGELSDEDVADACSAIVMPTTSAPKAAARGRTPSPAPQLRYRALVADDHALNLRVVTRLLTTHGFDVTAVPDGRAALDALVSSYDASDADATPFDVCVLDVQMPVLDGPGCARAFRGFERERRPERAPLPLLALSAAVVEESAATCAEAGMDAYISKPLRAEDIAMVRAAAAEHAETRAMEEEEALRAPPKKPRRQPATAAEE